MAKFAAVEIPTGKSIWINLDQVIKIVPFEKMTTIHFTDGSSVGMLTSAENIAAYAPAIGSS